ncbi:Hypothetical predicted protein [Mytilus galloprovincialis]|uniref:Reverse transcriptase domain-containing protein n=1 Tax=Mytilus galloprovincialis TaxID=29158 RepID=A0A8B6C014_MYTGA|nr:Hypothetical predicted protein [Mytilus galloprovincialis]
MEVINLRNLQSLGLNLTVLKEVTRGPIPLPRKLPPHQPPLSPVPIPLSNTQDPQKFLLLSTEVETLSTKRAVEEVPVSSIDPGFYSRLFLVSKKTGGMIPVIDLSILNSYMIIPNFKMETNRSIRASILPSMWTTSLDLTDAYFHVPVCHSYRKFLRFVWNKRVYQFRVLPFGLSTAPLAFTKLMQVAIAHLHSQAIQIHSYLDDSLIKIVVRHVPGKLNVLADALSRTLTPVNTEWELLQAVFQAITLHWGSPHLDLFAKSLNYKVQVFMSPVPDPKAYAIDYMSVPWDGMFAYAFPPFRFLSQVLRKISHRARVDHSYCSRLDQTSLVSKSSSSVLCSSTGFTSTTQYSVPVQGQDTSFQSREATSVRVAALMNSFKERGFSECAARHLSGAVRESTNIVYDAKWTIFSTWCSEKEIGPFQISVQQLADFLIHLFEEKGLSPSIIKGYRSAISRTIQLSGGPDFGNTEFISLLVKNFTLERPIQRVLIPS